MKMTFNTGRGYTEEGQVITVEVDRKNEAIHFVDHSRGVRGKIPYVGSGQLAKQRLADLVMQCYDLGNYSNGEKMLEREEKVIDYIGFW